MQDRLCGSCRLSRAEEQRGLRHRWPRQLYGFCVVLNCTVPIVSTVRLNCYPVPAFVHGDAFRRGTPGALNLVRMAGQVYRISRTNFCHMWCWYQPWISGGVRRVHLHDRHSSYKCRPGTPLPRTSPQDMQNYDGTISNVCRITAEA